jgi:hypothetical protein
VAGFPPTVRRDDGNEPAVGVVVGAMAASLIEEHEAVVTQERIDRAKEMFARDARILSMSLARWLKLFLDLPP